jgi:hypothetical protein
MPFAVQPDAAKVASLKAFAAFSSRAMRSIRVRGTFSAAATA